MRNNCSQISSLLTDDELYNSLVLLPQIRTTLNSKEERLLALLDIYKIYIPNRASVEIYNNLYFSILNSLEKKETIDEVKLINKSHIKTSFKKYGVIGGLDSFKITGLPGVGKSATINRCIDIICGNKLVINTRLKREVIPALVVECPADGSFKSLLYSILQQIDFVLGSNYFGLNSGRYITTDYLLNVVSVVLINHVGVLIIDEIERVATDKSKGITLINYLTQLINQTNVGVCFVGNESANAYFSIKEYLSRRTVGISVKRLNYDEFIKFCEILFRYQYTNEKVNFNSAFSQVLYRLTNGTPALIVGLYVETQKYAIINDISSISIKLIEKVFDLVFNNMISHLETEEKKALIKYKEEEDKCVALKDKIESVEEKTVANIYKVSNKDIDTFLRLLAKKIRVEVIDEN